jgi:hypothetical protein
MTTLCPVCKKDDKIENVKSIVQSGTLSGSMSGPTGGITYSDQKLEYTGGYETLRGSWSTALAQTLAAPSKLEPKRTCSQKFFLGFCWFNLFGDMVAFLSFGIATTWIPMILMLAIWITAISLLSRNTEANNKWNKEEFPKLYSEWERKMTVYKGLYYCHRDGVVFDPVIDKYMSPENIASLLL